MLKKICFNSNKHDGANIILKGPKNVNENEMNESVQDSVRNGVGHCEPSISLHMNNLNSQYAN